MARFERLQSPSSREHATKPRYRCLAWCGFRSNLLWRMEKHNQVHLATHIRIVLKRMKRAMEV
jgi:hypothetical protein